MNEIDEIKKTGTTKKDIAILNEIEQELSVSIPQVMSGITNCKLGYKITNNRITELSICSVDVNKVIEKIFSLVNLEKLFLHKANLIEIPDSIKNLINLTELDLKENSLESLPQQLLDLTKLRYLNVCNNKLKTWSVKAGQLPLLKILELENNKLESVNFDENASFLLEELYLNKNRISELHIEYLINLKYLSAQFNQLTTIPKMSNFSKLSTLELDFNSITEITKEIENAPNLVEFSISYNKITNVGLSIGKLRKIAYFFFDGNIINKASEKKLQSLVKTRSEPTSFFYE